MLHCIVDDLIDFFRKSQPNRNNCEKLKKGNIYKTIT